MICEVASFYGEKVSTILKEYCVQQVMTMYEYAMFKQGAKREKPVTMIDDSAPCKNQKSIAELNKIEIDPMTGFPIKGS